MPEKVYLCISQFQNTWIMQYFEVVITLQQVNPFRDLLIDALGNEGPYDSFEEVPTGLKAYVAKEQYDESFLRSALVSVGLADAQYTVNALPDKDWNEEWERGHAAVLVEDFCWVRAPFHPIREDVKYNIEIEPKMSFGTAHHATTYMMLTFLRDLELEGKEVLDMGCGTAVLAILAALRGARHVDAVDVDEWAWRNAEENVERNGVADRVTCLLGDASLLKENRYDVVLANINRNILLADMERYHKSLRPSGVLLLSGFYHSDVAALQAKAAELGMSVVEERSREGWSSLEVRSKK